MAGLSLSFKVAREVEKVAGENTVVMVTLPCLFMKVARAQKCNAGANPRLPALNDRPAYGH